MLLYHYFCALQLFYIDLLSIHKINVRKRPPPNRNTPVQLDGRRQYTHSNVEPGVSCNDLHGGTSCLYEIFHNKAYLVMKKSAKFYFILHFMSFLLFRARKIRDKKKLKEALFKLVQTYVGSLLFMSTMVGGNKLFLCFADKLDDKPVFDGIFGLTQGSCSGGDRSCCR